MAPEKSQKKRPGLFGRIRAEKKAKKKASEA